MIFSTVGGENKRTCLAILLGGPLSVQNVERMGLPYLSSFVNIVIFDCNAWLGRSSIGLHHEKASWKFVENIGTERDFEKALNHHQPKYALDFIGLCRLTPILQALLATAGTHYVVQKSGNIPSPSRFFRLLLKLRPQRQRHVMFPIDSSNAVTPPVSSILPELIKKLLSNWKLRFTLLSPDLALLAGRASINHFTKRAKQILWIGSQDYHLYQNALSQNKTCQSNQPFILFIDDNLPFASDWTVLGISSPVSAQKYYQSMRRFLDSLESTWGMKVIIAGHPSSYHDQRVKEGFGTSEVIYGQTARLVINASVILAHGSTAVSFAILDKKPLMFLTTEELSKTTYGLHVNTMAKRLGLKVLNIDNDYAIPVLSCFQPNLNLYNNYIEDFICSADVREDFPWQAFLKHILLKS